MAILFAKENTLIIYTFTTKKPRGTNRMPAIYAASCDCQMFQVNFIPSLAPNWKTAVWFFVQNDLSFAFSQDDRWIAMLLLPGHNHAAFLILVP